MTEQVRPKFWKLSQGGMNTSGFRFSDMLKSIDDKLVYVHKDTQALGGSSQTQFENFVQAKIGDYFYLTHSNEGIYLLGQFTGSANYISKNNDEGWQGWVDRPFRVICYATHLRKYDDEQKWWTPNHNSTFVEIPHHELALFEEKILQPYFDIALKNFGL